MKPSPRFVPTCAISSNSRPPARAPEDGNRTDDLIAAQQAKLARLLDEREALARRAWALLRRGAQREAPRQLRAQRRRFQGVLSDATSAAAAARRTF
jgi:hypothetical protein